MDKTPLQGCFQEWVPANVSQNEPTHVCEKLHCSCLYQQFPISAQKQNNTQFEAYVLCLKNQANLPLPMNSHI